MLEKIEFFIEPRQSGKTSKILKDMKVLQMIGQNVLYIGPNRHYIPSASHCFDQQFQVKQINGVKYDTVFLDEYLFFEDMNIRKCNAYLPAITKNIIIRTTAKELVNKNILNLVQNARKYYISNCLDLAQPEVNYLYHNLISHPKTELITKHNDWKEFLTEEAFKTEVMGLLFK